MIKAGYKRHVAGAIEPAASTGGMFMPPIMGAGVFIMAEMIRVPYTEIMVVALVPAILYFFSVGAIAHFEAARENIPVLPRSEGETPCKTRRQGWNSRFRMWSVTNLRLEGRRRFGASSLTIRLFLAMQAGEGR